MERQKESLWEILKFIIIAALVVFVIKEYIAKPFIVSGSSMDPTFKTGQYLIVDELSYRFKRPSRGDVIVFKYPEQPSVDFIKRVIGLPGETVIMDEGKVTIKNKDNPEGFLVDEKYVNSAHESKDNTEIILGEKQYFVMGDNRAESFDSRKWGPLDENLIIGRPIFRLFPPKEISVFPGR